MSQLQTWADAPTTGAYTDNQTAEVLKPAGFKSPLWMLAEKKRIASGESLTIPHYENLDLPTDATLTEDEVIPYSKLVLSAKKITASEKGRGLKVTIKDLNRTFWDLKAAHNEQLQENLRREYNRTIRAALATMPVKYCTTGAAAGTFTTNGTPSGVATDDINIYHLQRVSNYMQDDLRVPFRDSGAYAAVFRQSAVFHIQRDSEFQAYHAQQGLSPIANMAVGKIADIEIMPANDPEVVIKTLGSSNNISEGFILGKQAVCLGYVQNFEIRYDFSQSKATDMGRIGYMAYVGDYGVGLYSDSANAGSVRGVHFSSTS